MERSASSPARCSSAGAIRPSPTRVPLGALHWAPGGRTPEALKASWLTQGRSFNGGGYQGFQERGKAGCPVARCLERGGRQGFEGRKRQQRRVPSSPVQSRSILKLPDAPSLGQRSAATKSLRISSCQGSVRPASASALVRKDEPHAPPWQRSLVQSLGQGCLDALDKLQPCPPARPVDVTATKLWKPAADAIVIPSGLPLRPLALDSAVWSKVSKETADNSRKLGQEADFEGWNRLGKEAEAKLSILSPITTPISVSLMSSVNGQMQGMVNFRSQAQAKSLGALLASACDSGGCSMRSTVDFWDGDVAACAEGRLTISQKNKTTYEISHNFLELIDVDLGATLTFEDVPDMRIVVQGPDSDAIICLHP